MRGRGARGSALVDDHARLVDVGPTLATLAGVPEADLRDAQGAALDGAPLTAYLQDGGRRRRGARVVGILWDGAHCGELLHLAETGELPGVAPADRRGAGAARWRGRASSPASR